MTCDFCPNPATYRAKAAMGPPLFVCDDCSKEMGPLYGVKPLEDSKDA